MAYTDPNAYYYAAPTSNRQFSYDVVRMLCGEHPSVPSSTVYTVIDSWDGTTREVPTDNLLANSTNDWDPTIGTPPASGSWIVLQAQETATGNLWQCRVYFISSTDCRVYLYPKGNWVPGGGTGGSPSIPSPNIEISGGFNASPETAYRNVVWDGAMFAVFAPAKVLYCGEYNSFNPTLDDYPFLATGAATSFLTAPFSRKNPTSDAVQTSGEMMVPSLSAVTSLGFGGVPIYEAVVHFESLPTHTCGILRHVGLTWNMSGYPYTLTRTGDTRTWIVLNGSTAFRHDGTVVGTELDMAEVLQTDRSSGYPLIRTRPWLVRGSP